MAKTQKNFSIDTELLTKLKHKAVELNIYDGELICRYIEEGLKRDSNQKTLDDELEISSKKQLEKIMR